ncbi:transposase [Aquimarina sp. ERC-38]|uniref:IS66 family transposase n=1 Tax=Aquimarina sp. ERC-38 TaxID=2949996 RepID=UPI0022463553|nr:transposase [Aquimarina sp. ERC-38]UZO82681.1 transposase [Aquimarina sp. ERC-38]
MGKAFKYSLKLWDKLKRYIVDGYYEIDNKLVENTIRPLVLGLKNYLFSGSYRTAQKAAILYSLFASLKMNNIDLYSWLKDILKSIQKYEAN